MELFLRIMQFMIKIAYTIVYKLLNFVYSPEKNELPPIEDDTILLSLTEVLKRLQTRELSSVELLESYMERIRDVNPYLNAIVETRFDDALEEANRVDAMLKLSTPERLNELYKNQPLLGVPFTVKEACGVKDLSFEVGSLKRQGMKSKSNGAVISILRSAGAIPLLVSANPEYCFSIETNTYTNGKCCNAYDATKSSGGSSGGEGALNGAGATLFGIGSDIAGSIRIPSLFNGVFGHKPTGGAVSVSGHFPHANDADYIQYLQLGPITRFASDLSLILHVMAGNKASKLHLLSPVQLNQMKIYYSLGFTDLNGILHHDVHNDISGSILNAANYFKQKGLPVKEAKIKGFRNSTEIALSSIAHLHNFPFLIENPGDFPVLKTLSEYSLSVFGLSDFTKDGLIFELMRRTNGFMPTRNSYKYRKERDLLRSEIIRLLGDNGVLFFPTFTVPAIHHNSSLLPLWAIDYTLIFNVCGLPATHVTMGLNKDKLPVGFQVIASPFKDRLCIKIAEELEAKFGGWVPPEDA
ncbi:fatty-acid amide hydrolase 2-B-like [Teleopsis dalmanni]|uniref:fatty-acid amide hydrolase 2-B-like n=1 Tax=Teleopsis dalmanni TaxID=139649 RepID=UPI0018CF65E4|nr:fatty-acid amide hydrolase 2-B-like [Teleopsis dalmanni]